MIILIASQIGDLFFSYLKKSKSKRYRKFYLGMEVYWTELMEYY